MANDPGVRGLYPILNQNGAPPQIFFYRANTAAAIFRGQPVFVNNSGQVQAVDVNTSNNTNVSVGVAWEFLDANRAALPASMMVLPNSVAGTNIGPFLPASTDAFVGVMYDPMQFFLVEEDTAGSALTVNNLGQSLAWTYQATSNNNLTGYANITTVRATVVSTTGNMLQLVGVYDVINQDGTQNAPGNFCKWVVRIQRHQYGNALVSIPQ